MFKIIDSRNVKTKDGMLITLNIYYTKDKKEIVFIDNNYYYLSKDGLRITTRKVKD